MAGASSFHHPFPLKTLSAASPPLLRHHSLSPPAAAAAATSSFLLSVSSKKPSHGRRGGSVPIDVLKSSSAGRPAAVSVFRVRAVTDDDEWGREAAPEDPAAGGGVATAAVEEGEESATGGEPTEIEKLKKGLKDLLYGTDRGLKASSETRAEVVELITQLEAKNPTPAPTDALTLLNGKWILAYTSFSELFPLLAAAGRVPSRLVKVEEISQTIDSEAFTVQNSVRFAGPLATTSLTTNAKFEVRSPKRVQIKFEEGIIGTPQLTDSIVIPEKVEFFGQNIDLSPFKGVITSIQDAASSVARTISGQPPLKIPITNTNAQSWLLTTYLDSELRISRGDRGSVFVLIKEGSSLLD